MDGLCWFRVVSAGRYVSFSMVSGAFLTPRCACGRLSGASCLTILLSGAGSAVTRISLAVHERTLMGAGPRWYLQVDMCDDMEGVLGEYSSAAYGCEPFMDVGRQRCPSWTVLQILPAIGKIAHHIRWCRYHIACVCEEGSRV